MSRFLSLDSCEYISYTINV